MNGNEGDVIKKTIVDDEERGEPASDLGSNDVLDYLVELDGVSINVDVKSKDIHHDNLYAMRRRMLEYFKCIESARYKMDEVAELYKSSFGFWIGDYKNLYATMREDIKELDACYSAGAYKATLILAGSILEAFLLDWLSEIDGKNYFEEPYKVKVQKDDGSFMWEKKEQLNIYIEQIKIIERPDWMEPSQKAHFIRQNRNIVHAKVCLKRNVGINAETCSKVIAYLKEIIDTRLEKRKNELIHYCDGKNLE